MLLRWVSVKYNFPATDKARQKNQRGCISAYAASFRRNEATIRAQENCYKFWTLQQFLVLRASLAVTEQLAKTRNQSLETTKKWITNMASKLAQFQPMNLVTSSACSEIKRKARVALGYRLAELLHFSPVSNLTQAYAVNRLFKTNVHRSFSLLWNKEKGIKKTCSNLVRWFSLLLQYPGFHLKNKLTKADNNLTIYSAKDHPCGSVTELRLNLMWVASKRFYWRKKEKKRNTGRKTF